MIGALELVNQRVIARAYVRGAVILVVSLHYTRLPIAAGIGFLLFSEVPSVWVWVGSAVIAAAAVILTRGEARSGSGTGR